MGRMGAEKEWEEERVGVNGRVETVRVSERGETGIE